MSASVKNISVVFPGIRALKDVSIDFADGKIHAVLGANGCGKSTLVKVMTGIYTPEAGASLTIDKNTVREIKDPNYANALGIRVVHQEAPLINSLTVAECVALFKGYPKNSWGKIKWQQLYDYTRELLNFLDIDINPKELVGKLSSSERSMVAIAIAVGTEAEAADTKVLILDEADASIPEDEAEKFLLRVKRVAELGIPVIMVTHRLKDVLKFCDDVSILNDGEVVYSGVLAGIDEKFIVSKMLKSEKSVVKENEEIGVAELWKMMKAKMPEPRAGAVLEVEDLHSSSLHGISFQVKPGEIVGIAGLTDSGVDELPLILGGALNRTDGIFRIDGKELPMRLSPSRTIRESIALVPSDRFRQGGVMSRSLRDNILLPNENKFFLKKKYAYGSIFKAAQILDIRPPMPEMQFGKFSGGNQQKAIIAKWLYTCPKVLVLDDPTYGVDPAARLRIFSALRDAAANHVGIVVFSTEPEQLTLLCHRVMVLRKGKLVAELSKDEQTLTRESIARWCYE